MLIAPTEIALEGTKPPAGPRIRKRNRASRLQSFRAHWLTLAIFVATLAAGLLVIELIEQARLAERRKQASELNAQFARHIEQQLTHALSATHALAATVRQGEGRLRDFAGQAREMLPLYPGVSALQLAPGGIIGQTFPLAGNEKAIGHNLLIDTARNKEARLAITTRRLTLAGPFRLIQGGEAVIGRLPVFIEQDFGKTRFWGFTIALIRLPDFLASLNLAELERLGYRYELWRVHPDSGERHIFAHSRQALLDAPESTAFDVPNGRWYLSLAPVQGWRDPARLVGEGLVALLLSALLALAAHQYQRNRRDLQESEERFRTVADYTYDWEYWQGKQGEILYMSPSCRHVTGYALEEFMANPNLLYEIVHPEDRPLMAAHRHEISIKNDESSLDFRIVTKGGEIRWISHGCRAVFGRNEEFLGRRASNRDITVRKHAEASLRENEELLHAITKILPVGLWFIGADGNVVFSNDAAQRIWAGVRHVGLPQFAVYKGWRLGSGRLMEPHEWAGSRAVVKGETSIGEEIEIECFDGTHKIILDSAVPLHRSDGSIRGAVTINYDITERKRSEDMLRESESRLKAMFENLSSGVAVYQASPDGMDFIITAFNRAAERIENVHREDLIGKSVVEAFPRIAEFGLLEAFRRVWQSGASEHFPVSFYQDGRVSGWRENYVYKLPNGEIVAIYDDVTKEKQIEEQMYRLANYDVLTGLPNRTLLADRLQQSLATAKRGRAHIALMLLDLDKFKPVNDRFGHDIGDQLLKEVAKRLLDCVRESDTVSRLGGDEFVLLLPAIEATQDAMRVAEKILHALDQPFELAGHGISISASIGVAVYPEHGGDEKTLTKHADIAMYDAKRAGRNNARLFQVEMVESMGKISHG